mmetsp:Transcript_2385/g.16030  ORF Transcript_2385/g.16030 Transcript_2385/m.16030 type:complete len:240 (+) Transcript_2385:1403-2122(+)
MPVIKRRNGDSESRECLQEGNGCRVEEIIAITYKVRVFFLLYNKDNIPSLAAWDLISFAPEHYLHAVPPARFDMNIQDFPNSDSLATGIAERSGNLHFSNRSFVQFLQCALEFAFYWGGLAPSGLEAVVEHALEHERREWPGPTHVSEEFVTERVPPKEFLEDIFSCATVVTATLPVAWHISGLSQPVLAIPVIHSALLSVAQHLVGFGHEFEVLFGTCSIAWILVRVASERQFSVRFA